MKLFHPRTNDIRYLKSWTNKRSRRIISQIVRMPAMECWTVCRLLGWLVGRTVGRMLDDITVTQFNTDQSGISYLDRWSRPNHHCSRWSRHTRTYRSGSCCKSTTHCTGNTAIWFPDTNHWRCTWIACTDKGKLFEWSSENSLNIQSKNHRSQILIAKLVRSRA